MDIELGNCNTDPGPTTHTDRGMEIIPDEKDQTVRGDLWFSDNESSRVPEREPEHNAPLNFPSLTVTADDILKAVKDDDSVQMVIESRRSCGKTFLLNAILDAVHRSL